MKHAWTPLKDGDYPEIAVYGNVLKPVGRGKYPYDCLAKDKWPDAMIYRGDGCWDHEYNEQVQQKIKEALQSKQA
jgi:hypothetical protein